MHHYSEHRRSVLEPKHAVINVFTLQTWTLIHVYNKYLRLQAIDRMLACTVHALDTCNACNRATQLLMSVMRKHSLVENAADFFALSWNNLLMAALSLSLCHCRVSVYLPVTVTVTREEALRLRWHCKLSQLPNCAEVYLPTLDSISSDILLRCARRELIEKTRLFLQTVSRTFTPVNAEPLLSLLLCTL